VKLDIIIVLHNSAAYMQRLLGVLERVAAAYDCQIILVDSGSTDEALAMVDDLADSSRFVLLDPGRNVGFARGVNLGLPQLRDGAFTLLLNPDALIEPEVIAELTSVISTHRRWVAIAPSLYTSNGQPVSTARRFPSVVQIALRRASEMDTGNDVDSADWLCGACVLFKPGVLSAVGGLDERYFLYYEDVELGRRIRDAGGVMLVHRGVQAIHDAGHGEPASKTLRRINRTSRRRYAWKHHGLLGWLAADIATGTERAGEVGDALWRLVK
jgi:GT2 family glycosyltransferase